MAHKNNSAGIENLLLQFISEPDPLYSMLEWMANQLMEFEVAQKCGAEKGKHDENRIAQRSGTRVRRFDTRMGTVYLLVPKLRKGGYIPFFVTERKCSEQALIQVIFEAYTNGVSTRKIEKLANSLGIENISAAQVSQISKEMDQQIRAYSQRPLKKHYPVLWIDALYEKIRHQGKVISMAVMVVAGINEKVTGKSWR